MKKFYIPLYIFLVFFMGCKATKPAAVHKPEANANSAVIADVSPPAVDFHDQTTWILGYFNQDQLTHYPYSTWYLTGYDDYQVNTDAINKLLEINPEDLTIKIVMGIWCPDSRREVPRFMRVLDTWHFPSSKVTFIGVDEAKQSPVGEYTGLGIKRVPTFIIYKNKVEAGRIIENPLTSLEQDIVNILAGMNNNK